MYKRKNLNELLNKASYRNIDFSGKNVLIRAELNVTMKDGEVDDPTRILEAVPMIQYLMRDANRVVIMAHLGRPTKRDPEFSFSPVAQYLANELGREVILADTLEDINSEDSGIILLENIRFFDGEESDDEVKQKEFATQLAGLGEIFVNDAFASYRKAVSTYEIVKVLPSYIGMSFEKEIRALYKLSSPARPFVAVLGGAKLSEKLDVLLALCNEVDKVLIGGAMAYTLMRARGEKIGISKCEEDKLDVANEILEKYGDRLFLPIDHVLAKDLNEDTEVTRADLIPVDQIAIDVGSKTVELYAKELEDAKTIMWNGPMGLFEWDKAASGTLELGQVIGKNKGAFSLIGGGGSIAAITQLGIKGIDHVSTGGGAMLAFIANDEFKTLDVILDKF